MWVYVGASQKWTAPSVQPHSMRAFKDSSKKKYSSILDNSLGKVLDNVPGHSLSMEK